MESSTRRLQFIDLMKGVCIITVVIRHLYPHLFSGQAGIIIYAVQVPVFFFISGALEPSKNYTFRDNTVKNINRILIPYIFWFALGMLVFLPSEYLGFYKSHSPKADSLFANIKFFLLTPGKHLITNYPCWFLLALFEMKIFNLLLEKLSNKLKISHTVRYIFVMMIVVAVYTLCLKGIRLPLSISSAVITLPFFYVGKLLKNTLLKSIEIKEKYKFHLILVSAISCVFMYCFMETFDSNNCIVPSNIPLTYFLLFGGILVVYTLCLLIDHLALINYVGANSLVLLVTHVIVAKMLPTTLPLYLGLIITVCVSTLLIPVCNKFVPYFVGRKDLISFKNTKQALIKPIVI